MHSRTFRLFAISCWVTGLLGCDGRAPVAPDDESLVTMIAVDRIGSSSQIAATAVAPTAIQLDWEDNSTNETGFEIHRSTSGSTGTFALIVVAAANSTSQVDGSVPPGAHYCYKVRPFRQTGRKTSYGEFSNTACATTPNPPAAPWSLEAKPASSSAISVTWSDNSNNEQGFRLERSGAVAGPWEPVTVTDPNAASYEEPRASEQETCYRVLAFNADGDSHPSNVDCTAPPLAPTNLVAVAGTQSIDLTWTDNSSGEDGYWIYRSDDGVTFGVLAGVGPDVSTFSDVWPSNNTTYWYRVSARKDGGFSDASNIASAARSCTPTAPSEDVCDDGADNDCDDVIDWYDPDCGAARCDFDQCPPGYQCGYDGFCVPHCGDGFQNGDEGDVDCGGSCSAKCQTGQHCWTSWDCASGLCISGACQPAGGAQ